MNKRRKNLDRLLAIARSSREWVNDFVDIGALSGEQLQKVRKRLERLEEYARTHSFDYNRARLTARRAHQAGGAAQAAPAGRGSAAVGSPTGYSDAIAPSGSKPLAPLGRGTALLTGTPQIAYNNIYRYPRANNISLSNLSLVSAPPAQNTIDNLEGAKLSISPNPYQEVDRAFFAPVSSRGVVKDFDVTFDVEMKDPASQGRVDYDWNLLEQIEERQKKGLLPQFDGLDWDKIRESNDEKGLLDFYGGIDGGTTLTYQGDWFKEETENVVPEFARFALREMVEDEDGVPIESDSGGLYLETTSDERLTEYFKSVGAYVPQNDKEAVINDWLEREGDERKVIFFQYLDRLQDEAKKQQSEFKKAAMPIYLDVKGGRWQMMPSGMGSGVSCRWRLERGGVKIGIHSNPKEMIPAVIVEFGYQALKFRKFPDVVADVEAVLKAMGFNIRGQKISRIDVQLTLELPFQVVARAFEEKLIVSRVKKWEKRLGSIRRMDTDQETQTEYETFRGGCGDTITVRLYDKIKECFKAPEALEKLNDLYAVMGVRPHLTRIEFQIRRNWLNEYKINTVVDFYAKLPEIIRYLTGSYFRVLDGAKTTHVEKQKTAKWWDDVQKKFELAFNATFEGKALQKVESKVFSPDALMKQALGCMKAAFSCLGGDKPMDKQEFYCAGLRFFKLYMPQLYDDYVKLWKTNRIQREPITSLKTEFDYSEILQARRDLMIDDETWEGEGD